MNDSPCLTCVKVDDPSDCENKYCPQWRSWWLKRWRNLRRNCGIYQAEKADTAESCACDRQTETPCGFYIEKTDQNGVILWKVTRVKPEIRGAANE